MYLFIRIQDGGRQFRTRKNNVYRATLCATRINKFNEFVLGRTKSPSLSTIRMKLDTPRRYTPQICRYPKESHQETWHPRLVVVIVPACFFSLFLGHGIEMLLLSNNIHDYYFVSQGKTTIPGLDDGEELLITDVSASF